MERSNKLVFTSNERNCYCWLIILDRVSEVVCVMLLISSQSLSSLQSREFFSRNFSFYRKNPDAMRKKDGAPRQEARHSPFSAIVESGMHCKPVSIG
jgi:hypothetical protein